MTSEKVEADYHASRDLENVDDTNFSHSSPSTPSAVSSLEFYPFLSVHLLPSLLQPFIIREEKELELLQITIIYRDTNCGTYIQRLTCLLKSYTFERVKRYIFQWCIFIYSKWQGYSICNKAFVTIHPVNIRTRHSRNLRINNDFLINYMQNLIYFELKSY